MQERRLEECILQTSTSIKQPNGTNKPSYSSIDTYKVIKQDLVDEVSSNTYGANINKTYRISSPYKKLENYLITKINSTEDNISKYYVLIENKRYKVVSIKTNWIDIELL